MRFNWLILPLCNSISLIDVSSDREVSMLKYQREFKKNPSKKMNHSQTYAHTPTGRFILFSWKHHHRHHRRHHHHHQHHQYTFFDRSEKINKRMNWAVADDMAFNMACLRNICNKCSFYSYADESFRFLSYLNKMYTTCV